MKTLENNSITKGENFLMMLRKSREPAQWVKAEIILIENRNIQLKTIDGEIINSPVNIFKQAINNGTVQHRTNKIDK